jgi:hypothetical protein
VDLSATQVNWMKQMVDLKDVFLFTLHVDGKYKVHYGGWLLHSIGTHALVCERNG